MKNKGFTLVEGLLLILVVLTIGFGGFYVWNETNSSESDEPESSQEQSSEESDDEETEESSGIQITTDDFTMTLPEGFEESNTRQFTFTGEPATTYTYLNSSTGEYFEVNLNPAQSGINPDATWTYTTDANKNVSLVDSSDTVCSSATDEWCTTDNNGRVDIYIANSDQTDQSGVYFTAGYLNSEDITALDFVEEILNSIQLL